MDQVIKFLSYQYILLHLINHASKILTSIKYYTFYKLLLFACQCYLGACPLYLLELLVNPLTTVPEISLAGVYGECVLKQNLPVFNGLNMNL